VVSTKSALLQADGDIVGMDGVSAVSFNNVTSGSYYVAIRHRNSVGFRTQNSIALTSTTLLLNFTNNTVPLFGITPNFLLNPNLAIMNGGDANGDGAVDSGDSALWQTENGFYDNYALRADLNMDGSVDSTDSSIWNFNNGKYEQLE
jgi:hypothetical protein